MGSRQGQGRHGQHDVKAQESFGRLLATWCYLFAMSIYGPFFAGYSTYIYETPQSEFGWISMGQQSRWDGYRLKWLFTVASSCVKKQQSNVLTKEWNYNKHEGKKHASTLYQASALNCRIYFIFIFLYYCELNLQVTE